MNDWKDWVLVTFLIFFFLVVIYVIVSPEPIRTYVIELPGGNQTVQVERCYIDTGGLFSGGTGNVVCSTPHGYLIFRDATGYERVK